MTRLIFNLHNTESHDSHEEEKNSLTIKAYSKNQKVADSRS